MRPIGDLLPHRPPWALVDRVISVEESTVTAEKRVSAGDPLCGQVGLGGPLLLEALAQTAACLMGAENPGRSGHRGYLVAARGWKFPSSARPGETVTLVAKKVSALGELHGFEAVARAGERELASGAMTFAVRFE
jgi:3-hydroxymyristoyl/3-hydroxydecanoyl-(acyl carrier protein) dehydratase